ncbi:multiple epidermal growth factor-like domains protein 10 [Patella vulgata]|uniref:multiple epidermal growth factor-like domains protein 10 n=1 Tax=Patella vulgata TaxID=6465 RepID=UPI0024A7D74C|nr:multiple epidermal growth factor-like domains protein 10 [Patella vulgata]
MKLSNTGQCNGTGLESARSCYTDTSHQNHTVYNIAGCNQTSSTSLSGRFVFIQNKPKQALTLCEVQVFKGGCPDGNYGEDCEKKCNINCKDGLCNSTTGNCNTCKSGFTGDKCETCQQGKYGDNCQQNCSTGCLNNNCSKSNGTCGSKCSSNCSAVCDKSSGMCRQCKPNTVGPYCNSTCGSGCQPITGNITCDRKGRCTSCIMGRYGDRCDKNCTITCNGGCDRYNGTCINGCIKGKSGEYCDKNCNYNCIHCKQDDDNSCTECKDGRWRTSCNEICSFTCKPRNIASSTSCNATSSEQCTKPSCDQMTGNCSLGCIAGKKGNYCSENCSAGYYGDNCANACGRCARGTPCNTTSGSCEHVGCEDGFIGLMCSEATPKPDGAHPAVAILAILTVVGVVSFIGVKIRERYMKDNQQPTVTDSENETEEVSEGGNEVVMYSNLPNSGVYENLPSTRIELKDLWEIIQRKKTAKTFKPEYENLPKGLCSPHDVCLNKINRPKNRYKDICASN